MSYQTNSITALADIPAIVGTFLAGLGWTVDSSNPNIPKFTHPSLGGAEQHQLRQNTVSNNRDLILERVSTPTSVSWCFIRDPKLNVGGSLVVQNPTTLHLFGSMTPEPYFCIVVEYGFNSYRHLYFGYLERLGFTGGGEVKGAANPHQVSAVGARTYWQDRASQYLFRGRCGYATTGTMGGARIPHANNPNEQRFFNGNQGPLNSLDDFDADEIYGGFGDGINDGHVVYGRSPFAGINILVPMNLYCVLDPGANTSLIPVGRPPGVRMVNMTDLEPASQIVVGGNNWRVFPAFRKSLNLFPPYVTGQNWPTEETSYLFGYAYPE